MKPHKPREPKYKIEEMTADEIYNVLSKATVRVHYPMGSDKFTSLPTIQSIEK
jgi:hypothetical protein